MATATNPADFTVGVEEEYQLVDARSGTLRSRARAVLATDWTGEMKPEMLASSIEVGTSVCHTTEELRADLARRRLQAAIAAEADGLRVVATGVHPYAPPGRQQFISSPVYDRLREEYRSLAYQQSIFGLHVHVGIPAEHDRALIMNVVRHFLPHMLAISASSPLHGGQDTGYASFRSILWRRWPRSGPPPRMTDFDEYRKILDALVGTGWIDSPARIYWEMRPHHVYPTIEFRVADVTLRMEDTLVIAALTRCLVVAAAEGALKEPDLPVPIQNVMLNENGWKASRDGLEAEFLVADGESIQVRPVRAVLEKLVRSLADVAQRLGDTEALALLPSVLERGDAAGRVRAKALEVGNHPAQLVSWLAGETVLGLGLDRRMEQRDD